jgi:hypothetical protein
MHFSEWSTAQKIDEIAGNHPDLNTASQDGCPIQSPDGTPLHGGGLLFASRRVTTGVTCGLGDIYLPATAITELNDAAANDIQPNVRKDGREIVFSSNRAGGAGGQDIWTATRDSVDDAWSAPVNLGSSVNTSLGESRPSLSWDAKQLLFGRAGPAGTGEGGTGLSDIYVATREKVGGAGS